MKERVSFEEFDEGYKADPSDHSPNNTVDMVPLVVRKNPFMDFLRCERGSLSYMLLAFMLIFFISASCLLIGLAFGARKNAVATYDWFSESMEFAAQAANQDGDTSQVTLREAAAQKYFQSAFAKMTNTTYNGSKFTPQGSSPYPSAITLEDFDTVEPGDEIPYGTAKQPGYIANY